MPPIRHDLREALHRPVRGLWWLVAAGKGRARTQQQGGRGVKLLDLFCCEGGAAIGYARAGWDVTGVDLEPKFAKRYPFEFHTADALEYVREHGHEYDAIHASPPCQGY